MDASFAEALTTALKMHDKKAHKATPASKVKLDPPQIGAAWDPDQWSAFTRQWAMYKAGMFTSDSLASTALFYCCSPDLHTDIMRDLQDDVSAMKEEDVLAAIRRLAVKDESSLFYRIRLSKMTQSPGTGIYLLRQFERPGFSLSVHSQM